MRLGLLLGIYEGGQLVLAQALQLRAVGGIGAYATAIDQILRIGAINDVVVSYAIDGVNLVIDYPRYGRG